MVSLAGQMLPVHKPDGAPAQTHCFTYMRGSCRHMRAVCCAGLCLVGQYHLIWVCRPVPPEFARLPTYLVRWCFAFSLHELNDSGHPESNRGPSDSCINLQSDALPTEL